MYRQGDVFVKKIEEINLSGAVEIPRENGAIVLAHGEATGHKHAIQSPNAALFSVNSKMILIVKSDVNLSHEEHRTITFPVGAYEVKRQREYTPDKIRYVAD
jgi:hypothetical protein